MSAAWTAVLAASVMSAKAKKQSAVVTAVD